LDGEPPSVGRPHWPDGSSYRAATALNSHVCRLIQIKVPRAAPCQTAVAPSRKRGMQQFHLRLYGPPMGARTMRDLLGAFVIEVETEAEALEALSRHKAALSRAAYAILVDPRGRLVWEAEPPA
jgi:hypothetical protein